MTIAHLSEARNAESLNARDFVDSLRRSAPELEHPDTRLSIASSIYLPSRQLDLVVVFEDRRPPDLRFRTRNGIRVDSFILVVEAKRHSPDRVRFRGTQVQVAYGTKWVDATGQSEAQVHSLKTYQKSPDREGRRREATHIYNLIWLADVPAGAVPDADGFPKVLFAGFTWSDLLRAMVDQPRNYNVWKSRDEAWIAMTRGESGGPISLS